MNKVWKNIWDFIVIGVIGLNSFILLISRASINGGMKIVVISFTFFYALFLLLTIFIRNYNRKLIVEKIRKIFKVIYVLLYLTIINFQLVKVIEDNYITNKLQHILYCIIMAIGVCLIIPSNITVKKVCRKVLKK